MPSSVFDSSSALSNAVTSPCTALTSRSTRRAASRMNTGGELISGNMPPSKEKLIQAWMVIHKDELFADWALAVKGEEPFRIEPLR